MTIFGRSKRSEQNNPLSGVVSQKYDDVVQKCRQRRTLFEDPDFPAVRRSIVQRANPIEPNLKREFEWKRPKDISRRAVFVSEGTSRFDVKQGIIGNCWFVAALATLAINKTLLNKVVPPNQSFDSPDYVGAFKFNFWYEGKWIEVVVDDRLPVYNDSLVFMHSEDSDEFWSALVEKAYAKMYGCYEVISGGHANEALLDFTGGITENILVKKIGGARNLLTILSQAVQRGSLIGCGISDESRGATETMLPNGLLAGHQYSVTDVNSICGENLVRVRNPWGKCEWKGAWCDGSSEWNRVPQHERQKLEVVFQDDGEFWMSISDFHGIFSTVEICSLHPEAFGVHQINKQKKWQCRSLNGAWIPKVNAGGCPDNIAMFATNPQFRVTLTAPDDGDKLCTLLVSLLQKNRRKNSISESRSIMLPMGYVVYPFRGNPGNNAPVDQRYFMQIDPVDMNPPYANTREVTWRHRLPPGTYIIVPSTYEPNVKAEFLLRIFTEKTFSHAVMDEENGYAEKGGRSGSWRGPARGSPQKAYGQTGGPGQKRYPNQGRPDPRQYANQGPQNPRKFVNRGPQGPIQFVNQGRQDPRQFAVHGSDDPIQFINRGPSPRPQYPTNQAKPDEGGGFFSKLRKTKLANIFGFSTGAPMEESPGGDDMMERSTAGQLSSAQEPYGGEYPGQEDEYQDEEYDQVPEPDQPDEERPTVGFFASGGQTKYGHLKDFKTRADRGWGSPKLGPPSKTAGKGEMMYASTGQQLYSATRSPNKSTDEDVMERSTAGQLQDWRSRALSSKPAEGYGLGGGEEEEQIPRRRGFRRCDNIQMSREQREAWKKAKPGHDLEGRKLLANCMIYRGTAGGQRSWTTGEDEYRANRAREKAERDRQEAERRRQQEMLEQQQAEEMQQSHAGYSYSAPRSSNESPDADVMERSTAGQLQDWRSRALSMNSDQEPRRRGFRRCDNIQMSKEQREAWKKAKPGHDLEGKKILAGCMIYRGTADGQRSWTTGEDEYRANRAREKAERDRQEAERRRQQEMLAQQQGEEMEQSYAEYSYSAPRTSNKSPDADVMERSTAGKLENVTDQSHLDEAWDGFENAWHEEDQGEWHEGHHEEHHEEGHEEHHEEHYEEHHEEHHEEGHEEHHEEGHAEDHMTHPESGQQQIGLPRTYFDDGELWEGALEGLDPEGNPILGGCVIYRGGGDKGWSSGEDEHEKHKKKPKDDVAEKEPVGQMDDVMEQTGTAQLFGQAPTKSPGQYEHPYLNKSLTDEEKREKNLREGFKMMAGEDMELDAYELKEVLNVAFKQIQDECFSVDVCRSMIAMHDGDMSGKLGFEEFKTLYDDLRNWRQVFKEFDYNKNGYLCSYELRDALHASGFSVSNNCLAALIMRYCNREGELAFSEFVLCAIRLKTMILTFKNLAAGTKGNAKLNINQATSWRILPRGGRKKCLSDRYFLIYDEGPINIHYFVETSMYS